MQLLFESSDEMSDTHGLGLLSGHVTKLKMLDARGMEQDATRSDSAFRIPQSPLKIPHMGWNQIDIVRHHPLLRDVSPGAYAYFVHSYAVYPDRSEIVLATTDYGGPFASVVGSGSVCGLQFHPEKSQAVGLQMLRNFLEM
jgi:glutamine amidotransferase